jgi:hypothetical protein
MSHVKDCAESVLAGIARRASIDADQTGVASALANRDSFDRDKHLPWLDVVLLRSHDSNAVSLDLPFCALARPVSENLRHQPQAEALTDEWAAPYEACE